MFSIGAVEIPLLSDSALTVGGKIILLVCQVLPSFPLRSGNFHYRKQPVTFSQSFSIFGLQKKYYAIFK